MADQPLGFNAWARERRQMRGQMADTAENRRLMLDLQRGYADYLKQFQPATVQRAQLADGSTVDVVNGQVVRDARPKFETFVDDKGFMSRLNLDTGLVERATNAMGQPVKGKAKSSGWVRMPNGDIVPEGLAAMEDPTASPSPSPDPGMTNSMAFAGVPARGAYETNMAVPVAAPAATDAMSMTAPAATNAPVAAPGPMTPDQVRAAYRQKAISKEQARALLQGGL